MSVQYRLLHCLIEVPGIANKRVGMIQRIWDEQKSIKDVMVFLQGHNVSTPYAVKIYKQYGDNSSAITVKQVKQQQRYTRLKERLCI